MNTRVQRLFRAQKLLPIAARSFTSTHVRKTTLDSTSRLDLPEEHHSESPHLESKTGANEILEGGTEALKSKPTKPGLLHPTLAEGYEAGGKLHRSLHALDRLDKKGLGKWGVFGVCLATSCSSSGGNLNYLLPNTWLRDNCRCAKCVNQDTMQRAFDTFSLPQKIMPLEVFTEKEGLRIRWDEGKGDHESIYPWEWISKYKTAIYKGAGVKTEKPSYKYWGANIGSNPPSVQYDEIMADDKGVATWTSKIRKYGFCYVDGCPVSPEKTKELLERIAFIRVTHYGGFYDFTADLTMKDTAYTNLALPAHTDNTYFSDPSGLQAFHLLSHTDGSGGESLLVDGFHAASILLKEDKNSFEILERAQIPWHASGNEGIAIKPFKDFPVFNSGTKREGFRPELVQIRWNNDDRGVVPLVGDLGVTAERWYKAARKWNAILKRANMEYWTQLKPGRMLIFDNWRVLHGRAAFTGKRRICGAYINHDDYISRWRNTNFTREEVLNQIL